MVTTTSDVMAMIERSVRDARASAIVTDAETLRRLVLAVLERQGGMLQDDATLLMLEWAGDSDAVVPWVTPARLPARVGTARS